MPASWTWRRPAGAGLRWAEGGGVTCRHATQLQGSAAGSCGGVFASVPSGQQSAVARATSDASCRLLRTPPPPPQGRSWSWPSPWRPPSAARCAQARRALVARHAAVCVGPSCSFALEHARLCAAATTTRQNSIFAQTKRTQVMRDAGLADQFGRLYSHPDWAAGATTATIIATLQGVRGSGACGTLLVLHSSHSGRHWARSVGRLRFCSQAACSAASPPGSSPLDPLPIPPPQTTSTTSPPLWSRALRAGRRSSSWTRCGGGAGGSHGQWTRRQCRLPACRPLERGHDEGRMLGMRVVLRMRPG